MAEIATYVGIEPRTLICGADIGRGLRVITNASGVAVLAGLTVRGDFMAMIDGKNTEPSAFASLSGGGKIPAVASEQTAVGDPAYSAASGQTSKTATSAVLMGRWTTATAVGTLGEVELYPVA